jgi:hypothetical protein
MHHCVVQRLCCGSPARQGARPDDLWHRLTDATSLCVKVGSNLLTQILSVISDQFSYGSGQSMPGGLPHNEPIRRLGT